MLRLAAERARIADLWQGTKGTHVRLPVAAAFAFHELHDQSDRIVPLLAYQGDLNLVAAALSRHSSIYTLLDKEEGLTPLPVDLRNQRFANGAAELRCVDDGFFFDQLWIRRAEVHAAIALMKGARLSLTSEHYPVSRQRHQHGPVAE
jgi:hypothetical protein